MVLPLIPIAAGAVGAVGGMGLSQLLGSGKKVGDTITTTTTTTHGEVYHAPGEVYSPQVQYAPQYGYAYTGATYIINSPSSSSKKDTALSQALSPSQEGAWETPQTYSTQPAVSTGVGTGISEQTILIVAALGVAAIIGYALLQ